MPRKEVKVCQDKGGGALLLREWLCHLGSSTVLSSPCEFVSSQTLRAGDRIINGLVTWHLAFGLCAMCQAVELPASIADPDTNLANMDKDAFMHGCFLTAACR